MRRRLFITVTILALGVMLGCPIYRFLGVPCPCCGVTRAWLSVFCGEIRAAFSYNPCFLLITLVVCCFPFGGSIFKNRKIENYFFSVSGAIIFLQYIVRVWL